MPTFDHRDIGIVAQEIGQILPSEYVIGYGNEVESNTITMCAGGNEEMLKISPRGFWVRGVKVEQDEQEAQAVYEGFKAWLTWARLNGHY